jgi:hypothetical protein
VTSAARAEDPSLGLALVRGDLPFRLQRRLGLIPPDGLGLVRRAVFWSMLGWLPLLAFAGPLKKAKKQALLDYGALVGRHGRLVHERWIEGRALANDAVLQAPELGPVADTAALFDSVRAMRTVPISRSTVLPIAAAAVLPMLGALAIQVPAKELLLKLLKALV